MEVGRIAITDRHRHLLLHEEMPQRPVLVQRQREQQRLDTTSLTFAATIRVMVLEGVTHPATTTTTKMNVTLATDVYVVCVGTFAALLVPYSEYSSRYLGPSCVACPVVVVVLQATAMTTKTPPPSAVPDAITAITANWHGGFLPSDCCCRLSSVPVWCH